MQTVKNFLFIGIICLFVISANAFAAVDTRLQPSAEKVKISDTFDVEVRMSGSEMIKGIEMYINFDISKVEITDFTVNAAGLIGVTDIKVMDNNGEARFIYADQTGFMLGDDTLVATIACKATAEGNTRFEFDIDSTIILGNENPPNEISGEFSVTPVYVIPVPPTNLEARSGIDSVKLMWNPSPSPYFASYNVYRSEAEAGPYTKINTLPVTGDYYVDNSVVSGTAYYYYLKTVDIFGNESDSSNIASIMQPGQLKLFIPDSHGDKGDQIRLPINIAYADGLEMCSVDIYVTYDSSVLEATDIKKTPLTAGYGWDKNLEIPGIARAVLATVEGEKLHGEGSLFYVLFDVIGEKKDTSDLKFEVTGTFFYDCGDLFEPVPLELNDIGLFTVGCPFILGDVNGDCVVDQSDIDLVLEIAVGKLTPSDDQFNAADVSGDGFIRSNDASLIMKIMEGADLAPTGSELRRMRSARSDVVNVSVPDDLTVSVNSSVWVPIEIDNTANVKGADIILNYDSSLMTATDGRTTSMTESCNMEINTDQAGQVRISLIAKEGQEIGGGPGTLVEVQFTAKSDILGNSASPLTLSSVRLNDSYSRDFSTSALQVDVKTDPGTLTVKVDAGDMDHSGIVDLRDALLVLKVLTKMDTDAFYADADINGDRKIGIENAIYILRAASATE